MLGSDEYVQRLVALAVALKHAGNLPPDEAERRDFLVIPPGGVLKQDLFGR